MRLEEELLETLRCPVRNGPLTVMSTSEIGQLNAEIARGRAWHAGGEPVVEPLAGGLTTPDGSSVYRIHQDFPVLLPELRIVTLPPEPGAAGETATAGASGIEKIWENWSERWIRIPPPARPAPEDVALFQESVAAACSETDHPVPHALLLGVTPEIATMRWPARTRLLALDLSEAMIRRVWPRDAVPDAVAARANWNTMPVADATYDIVIGDGILLWQRYPEGVAALASEVRRVLKGTGAFVMRLFAKPDRDEPLEAVFDDLRRGRIPNSAALHLRIGTALHRDVRTGVRLGDAYDVWHANVPDENVLLPSLGWPPEMVGTFDVYRGLDTRVAYPTVAELTALLAPEFSRTACRFPGYDELGMFPTVVFRPKA